MAQSENPPIENSKPMEKKKDKKPRKRPRPWSQEEEKLFLEGLEIFGRDWHQIAYHVQSRDTASIRSHAQKHFIRCWEIGEKLPDKILESGIGYTLSGKPLNPLSGAVLMYTGQRPRNKRLQQEIDLEVEQSPPRKRQRIMSSENNIDNINGLSMNKTLIINKNVNGFWSWTL